MQRVGEVIEASTTEFAAQCYELNQTPPLGSLVKTKDAMVELYGIVYLAATSSLEPGRRPIARGKDATDDEAIYRDNPQLGKLLRSEFSALVVGHRQGDKLFQYLPPKPARLHAFVYLCSIEEVKDFSQSFDFLNILATAKLPVSTEELIGAALRQMAPAHADRHTFLVAAGKELATLFSGQFNQLRAVLGRIR